MTRNILLDAVGNRLELYSKKAESEEVGLITNVYDYICNVASRYNCSLETAEDMLVNADEDSPLEYYDEVLWTELPIDKECVDEAGEW